MRDIKIPKVIVFSILFLFFLQSLSDFIEAIYAFGLLVTAFTIEVASIILLFTPLLLLLFHKAPPKSLLLILSYIAILARLVEPMLNPSGKLVACGISVGAFMLLFPSLLYQVGTIRGWQITSGLIIAILLSIFLRTTNSSLDISESGIFQIISWIFGILASSLLWRMSLLSVDNLDSNQATSTGHIIGLAIGIASVILIIYFAFASPTVIARWTEFSYAGIVSTLVAVLVIFSFLLRSDWSVARLTQRFILGWNVLFVIMLVLTILPHQIPFPSDPQAYPFGAPFVPSWTAIFLFLMVILSPVLFVDFLLFVRQISLEKPSLHQIGTSFGVAALFFLMMVFFHVFTTIYDYAPIIGPVFRDRFWLVYFLVGLGLILPVFLLRKELFPLEKPDVTGHFMPLTVGGLALLSMVAIYVTVAKPTAPQSSTDLKIMTYNIQQGFDAKGNKNLPGQLTVIKRVNPDILGLQESDTARVANGNVDAVRYFADKLNMYSYYGPTTTTGTFGIALLSKYPIQHPTTFFMYSKGEQTAAIHAEITKDGKTYQVFVTHLGNGGPRVQLENLLTRIQGLDSHQPIIAVGDFNFRPDTDQYALMTRTLIDSWLLKWPGGKEISGFSSKDRIDYIFVSSEITVLESEYIPSPASDHPYLYSVIR